MNDDRIETATGQTPAPQQQPNVTVVERRGGGMGSLLIGLALLVVAVIAAMFLFGQSRNETLKTEAVSEAAKDVGAAADKIGDAAQDAVNKID